MKFLVAIALTLCLSPVFAASTGDVQLGVKSADGPLTPAWVTKTPNSVIGWDSGGVLGPIAAASDWSTLTNRPANLVAFGALGDSTGFLLNNGSGGFAYNSVIDLPYGGLGTDLGIVTGIPYFDGGGGVSFHSVLPQSFGGLGQNVNDQAGVPVFDGQGNTNVNTYLPLNRGGLAVDLTTQTGVPYLVGSSIAFVDLVVTGTAGEMANKIVQRDASGNVTSNYLFVNGGRAFFYATAGGLGYLKTLATYSATRDWTLPDKSGTIAMTSDITGTNSGTNTGDASLAGTPNYLTISGQTITRSLIDLTSHVTGVLPAGNGGLPTQTGNSGKYLTTNGTTASWGTISGSGTVTSASFTGGLISVATATTTPAFTVAGTSGGIPYFSSSSTWASSGALAANALVIGGGAGVAPATTTTGTGVLTALGINVGSSGGLVTNGGALGTPSGGALTNCTGLPAAGVVGTAAVLGANTFTAAQTASFGIAAATQSNGLQLTNTTAATSGNQTWSPSLRLTGNQWASGASRTCEWLMTCVPVQQDYDHAILRLQTKHGANALTNVLDIRNLNNSPFIELGTGNTITIGSSGGNGPLNLQYNGTAVTQWSGSTVSLSKNIVFTWTNGADIFGTADTLLGRDGAATLQTGADAATVTHQAIKAHDGSGTDKDGAGMTLESGQSTGSGRGGYVRTATSLTSATGSSANSYSTRSYSSAKPVDLTESTATLFCNVSVASSKIAGVALVCTVQANDGTDFQSLTSQVRVDVVNKAGTVTATISQTDNTTAASTGTLTCTYTAVSNGAGVDIKANAVSSLTQTVLRVKWSIVSLNSDDVGTITAQ